MNIRNSMIAGLAGVALIAGSLAAPTAANAGNGRLLAAGAIGFGLGLALSHPVYGGPVIYGGPVYQPRCTWEQKFVAYDGNGDPVYRNVQVCS